MSKEEAKKTQEKEQEKPKSVKFAKRQFLKAANFSRVERDVLSVLLKDDEMYTLEQVQKMLSDFKKERVK